LASRATPSQAGSKKAAALPSLSETVSLPASGATPVWEWDEVWSFVCSKAEPAWVWVALDRETRPVVACCLGDRSEESCRFLWEQVPAPWREATCYTDFWEAYRAVIPATQHVPAGKGSGETAPVERFNNTLRQRLGQFVRKTLSFSKCDQMHCRLKLFLHRYNLSCL
jgi:insertion element IS1 protein InsB